MSRVRPKILFISSSWPHGDTFGGQMRALHTARALRKSGDVTLTVVSPDVCSQDAMRATLDEFKVEPPVCPQTMPNRGLVDKFRWALDTRYLNVHGCAATPSDRERILGLIPQFDLVWLMNSRTPNILQIWRWPHAHLDVDDVPSTYLRAVSSNGATFSRRLKADVQRVLLKRREVLFTKRFDTLSVCSAADREYLGGGKQIHVIPNGFERPTMVPEPKPVTNPPRLGFIGLCTYAPNFEGVAWFLKHCWPKIRQEVPGARFRLAGKGTENLAGIGAPDVDILGWVADPAAEIATWSAMVVPIRFGGGTRIKIADAFSRKCPVVSTRLGAFGYEVEDGRELRLADTAEDFAAASAELLRDRSRAAAMADRAWRAFLEHWTWDAIGSKVNQAAEDCLRRSGSSAGREPSPVLMAGSDPGRRQGAPTGRLG